MTPHNSLPAYGPCRFRQLPKKYQEAFESGANRIENVRFVAESDPWSVMIMVPFFMLFAACPILLVKEIPAIHMLPWGIPALVVLLIGTVLSCRCTLAVLRSVRMRRGGRETYGLLLDEDNLVVRRMELWQMKDCVFLPRDDIAEFELTAESHSGSGGRVGKTQIITAIRELPSGKRQRIRVSYGDWLTTKPAKVLDMLVTEWQT